MAMSVENVTKSKIQTELLVDAKFQNSTQMHHMREVLYVNHPVMLYKGH
jgi:hypothetical protein